MEPLNTHVVRKRIISLKSRTNMKRTWFERCADWLTSSFGTVGFLIFNAVCFAAWIIVNGGMVVGIQPFDPFPFSLLTTIVSLEAIVLSIIVLISQNRATKVDELRQELDLQLDVIAEQEITKIIEMLTHIMKNNKIDVAGDTALQEMLKPTDTKKIEEDLKKQI